MRLSSLLPATAVVLLCAAASAQSATQSTIPQTQIPPSVLAELRQLENQFELALAQDCASSRCFAKGCTYGEHAVADQPQSGSLPGLGQEAGPGSVRAQEYLTLARCAFAHEKGIRSRDVQALVRRLQLKLSKGWIVVQVQHETLAPIAASLREEIVPPEPPVVPVPEPVAQTPVVAEPTTWEAELALRELWVNLLPHFAWMIALFLLTLAALIIIWALRRLGRESLEEKALLAQLAAGEGAQESVAQDEGDTDAPVEPGALAEDAPVALLQEPGVNGNGASGPAFVAEQRQLWAERLAVVEPQEGDDGLRDLVREWLESRELGLLAKAVLLFPERLPLAFPDGGELAAAKLELADYLKRVSPDALPSDEEFFRKLNQHVLSSSLASQADAEIVRSLRHEFGAVGLAELIDALPPRHGALLFAFAPAEYQHEIARLLSDECLLLAAEQLLVSNRMDRDETAYLFAVLGAVRADKRLPAAAERTGVSDRGRVFNADAALSVLLAHADPGQRGALFATALRRGNGAFPQWYEGILYADMLLRLSSQQRAELLLDVDIRNLAGWLSTQPSGIQEGIVGDMSASLRDALRSRSAFGSRAEQMALFAQGREELAVALQRQIAQGELAFEDVVL